GQHPGIVEHTPRTERLEPRSERDDPFRLVRIPPADAATPRTRLRRDGPRESRLPDALLADQRDRAAPTDPRLVEMLTETGHLRRAANQSRLERGRCNG